MQVHSSEYPQIWNMTKCLFVALCTAAVGIAGSVVLLFSSLPERLNWFQYFGTPIDHGLPTAVHSTNGQVCLYKQSLWTSMSADVPSSADIHPIVRDKPATLHFTSLIE